MGLHHADCDNESINIIIMRICGMENNGVCSSYDRRVRLERNNTAPLIAERIANVPASMVWNKGPPPKRCKRCCTASSPKSRIPTIEASIRIRFCIIFISIHNFNASYKHRVKASVSG